MKKIWLIAALVIPAAFWWVSNLHAQATPPARNATAPIVGYVSATRLFQESAAGKADLARVQALQQQRSAELRTRQQTLETTNRQLAQATDAATRSRLQQQEQL